MTDLRLRLYSDMIRSISRGNYRGVFLNAKPIYALSLIDSIPYLHNNIIKFPNILLKEIYETNKLFYDINCKTPIITPFFHLGSEPFYELVWKEGKKPHGNSRTPSAKYLRENLEYAKLDDDLWTLLQIPENRAYLKNAVIDRYLK